MADFKAISTPDFASLVKEVVATTGFSQTVAEKLGSGVIQYESDVLVVPGAVSASLSGENGVKSINGHVDENAKVSRVTLSMYVPITRQSALRMNNDEYFATVIGKSIENVPVAAENTFVHGTDFNTGKDPISAANVTIESCIVKNGTNVVMDAKQSVEDAINAATEKATINQNPEKIGFGLTRKGIAAVKQARTANGTKVYEDATYRDMFYLDGFPAAFGPYLGRPGANTEETDILAIAGDWSKIRKSIMFSYAEVFTSGLPDANGIGIERKNQIANFMEWTFSFAIIDPSSFIVLRAPKVTG